jgi:hypothetical protein
MYNYCWSHKLLFLFSFSKEKLLSPFFFYKALKMLCVLASSGELETNNGAVGSMLPDYKRGRHNISTQNFMALG